MSSKVSESQTELENYQTFPLKVGLWPILMAGAFVVGLFGHLSVGPWLESKLNVAMTTIPGCQISYQEFSFSWFPLPELKVIRPRFQGSCSPRKDRPLELSVLALQFRGPGLFPFGAKFRTNIQFGRSQIDLYLTATPKAQTVAIKDGTINLSDLSALAPIPLELKGAALANALIEIENQKITKANYRLDFRSLEIPAQTVQALALPQLPLEKGQIMLTQSPNEILVENMELGGTNAPLRAEFKGKIMLNPTMPALSPLDLKGKVRFSPQLLQDFAVINLFTAGLKQDNGFYSVKIGGTLARPSPQGI